MRRLAGAALVLAGAQLGLAVGVRGWLACHGLRLRDFAAGGATGAPLAPDVRAAPFLDLVVRSTNAVFCGSLALILLTLVVATIAMHLRERRGLLLAMLALSGLAAAAWLGCQQSAALDGA